MTPAVSAQGWWRRNALALVVGVVLAGLIVWTQTARAWHDIFDYQASRPVVAAAGTTLDFDGTLLTVTKVERLYPGGLPRDTAAIRVTVDVAAAPEGDLPEGCRFTLAEAGGSHGERAWSSFSAVDVDILPVEGTTTICDPEALTGYTLALPYVVPVDADGDLTLKVEVSGLIPRYAALELGPLP